MNATQARQPLSAACPQCKGPIAIQEGSARCPNGHSYPFEEGIIDVMSDEERAAAESFLRQYETVRSAERWGNGSTAYYQHLPYKDITGEHTFEWRIKRASYTELLRQLEARNAETVLDVGAGNCWLSYRLWLAGFQGAATDIRIDDYDGLATTGRYWPRAGEWLRVRSTFQVPAFAPNQFDAVVFNASLHYAKHPGETLAAYLPLLTDGGALYVIDSPVYRDRSSGEQMMRERELEFRAKYNIEMTESTQSYFLTFDEIDALADSMQCTVRQHTPRYGWKWQIRPLIAKALRRREPASFGVYVFEKG